MVAEATGYEALYKKEKLLMQIDYFPLLNYLYKSHKSSLCLWDLVIHFIDVWFLFQYTVGLGLRDCHSNVRFGRPRSPD